VASRIVGGALAEPGASYGDDGSPASGAAGVPTPRPLGATVAGDIAGIGRSSIGKSSIAKKG
jgi:hypothetical protein